MRMLDHRLWPHLRATLILFHVLSMIVLSLPDADAFDDRRWHNDNARDDLGRMAARLRAWGHDTDAARLERDLRSAATGYLRVQQRVAAPFIHYAALTGSRQGWSMFASPQRHPAELHVDVERDGQWQPLYRPHSDTYAWRRTQLEHNRFRKFLGRFARGFHVPHYDQAARWIATRAAADHRDASRVRVHLYRYTTSPPEQVRAGMTPVGHYGDERVWDAEALR